MTIKEKYNKKSKEFKDMFERVNQKSFICNDKHYTELYSFDDCEAIFSGREIKQEEE